MLVATVPSLAVLYMPEHPTLRLNACQPVGHRGYPAEVLHYVLLADKPHGKNPAGRERERGAEEGFQHEDALAVVPEGPVPEVSHVGLAAVEPFMQPDVLLSLAAVLPGRTLGMVVGVRHYRSNSRVLSRVSVKFSWCWIVTLAVWVSIVSVPWPPSLFSNPDGRNS